MNITLGERTETNLTGTKRKPGDETVSKPYKKRGPKNDGSKRRTRLLGLNGADGMTGRIDNVTVKGVTVLIATSPRAIYLRIHALLSQASTKYLVGAVQMFMHKSLIDICIARLNGVSLLLPGWRDRIIDEHASFMKLRNVPQFRAAPIRLIGYSSSEAKLLAKRQETQNSRYGGQHRTNFLVGLDENRVPIWTVNTSWLIKQDDRTFDHFNDATFFGPEASQAYATTYNRMFALSRAI